MQFVKIYSLKSWLRHCCRASSLKGRHDSGNKGNFEGGQNKSNVYSYILKDRECTPVFVTMDTSFKLYFKRDNILQLRTSNSLVDCQLPCPPLMSQFSAASVAQW